MPGKVIQNGLPPLTLLLFWVQGFRIKRHGHPYAFRLLLKLHTGGTVAKLVLNRLAFNDLCVGTFEVKAK